MSGQNLALAAAFAAVGGAVGWSYFLILRRSVERLAAGGGGWAGRFVLLALARVALFAGGLAGAICAGNWSLMGYVAGFVVARTVVVARSRREAPAAGEHGSTPSI